MKILKWFLTNLVFCTPTILYLVWPTQPLMNLLLLQTGLVSLLNIVIIFLLILAFYTFYNLQYLFRTNTEVEKEIQRVNIPLGKFGDFKTYFTYGLFFAVVIANTLYGSLLLAITVSFYSLLLLGLIRVLKSTKVKLENLKERGDGMGTYLSAKQRSFK